jgi:hypothetical protein
MAPRPREDTDGRREARLLAIVTGFLFVASLALHAMAG